MNAVETRNLGAAPARSMTLLVSSMSARGRAFAAGRQVVRTLRQGGWQIDVRVMTADHDIEFEAAQSDSNYLGALGGDGFLTHAAKGARAQGMPLVPFPSGRGNDLCRSLGIGVDLDRWAKVLARATSTEVQSWVRPLDAMLVSATDEDGFADQDVALGIISLGIDGTANQIANASWIRSGPLAYAWGAVSGFLGKFKPRAITATIDGKQRQVGGWLCSISNTGWFGGGVNLVPGTDSMDGKLELVTVEPLSRRKVLGPLTRALLSRAADEPVIEIQTITKIRLLEPRGMAAMADGDVVARIPFQVEVLPAALSVVAADPKEILP